MQSSARLSYNWRQAYSRKLSGQQAQPKISEAYGQLNATVRYPFNDIFAVFIATNNAKSFGAQGIASSRAAKYTTKV